MAKQTNNNIRLGIFVTLAVALFTLAIYYVGARKNIFGVQFHISTLVKNANGLQTGNNVRYSGIVVGSVKDIVFINDSTLQIDMVLDKRAKTFIRKNAVASIGMDGLVGNVIVNISPGKGDSPLAKDGDVIASYTRQETSDMLETLGSTNANVALLSMKLLEISTKLNEGPGTLPLLIRDSLMATEVAQSLHYLRMATENIAIISRQLQAASGNIAAGKGTVGYLLHDETLPHQLEAFISRLDSVVIAQTEPVIADLKKSGADIAAASAELKSATEALNSGDGLASTLLKDTAAANDLLRIMDNLNEGTGRFNENMEALKHNFLFRHYFKKQEKEMKKKGK